MPVLRSQPKLAPKRKKTVKAFTSRINRALARNPMTSQRLRETSQFYKRRAAARRAVLEAPLAAARQREWEEAERKRKADEKVAQERYEAARARQQAEYDDYRKSLMNS